MSIPLYIRKDYFRAVILSDKSAHILQFIYSGENVDVFEQDTRCSICSMSSRARQRRKLWNSTLRISRSGGKGYGSVCLNEITDQLAKKNVTFIKAPVGYRLAPLGYEGPEQYQRLMAGFYEKTGFSISGDGDLAMKYWISTNNICQNCTVFTPEISLKFWVDGCAFFVYT